MTEEQRMCAEAAQQAHELVEEGHVRGKVVLTHQPNPDGVLRGHPGDSRVILSVKIQHIVGQNL